MGAGALLYVLLISLILLLIAITVITQYRLSEQIGIKNLSRLRAINMFQKFDSLMFTGIEYDKYELNYKIAEIETENVGWGIWAVLKQSIPTKLDTFKRAIMIGSVTDSMPALKVEYSPNGLGLLGKSVINGWVELATPKLYPAFLGLDYYTGNDLSKVRVTSDKENKRPRFFDSKLIEGIKNLTQSFDEVDSMSFNEIDEFDRKIERSFHSNPLVVYTEEEFLILSNLTLSGQILIVSNGTIRVTKTANLLDCVLIAPNVILEKEVNVKAQILCSQKIQIEKGASLEYPSALIILKDFQGDRNDEVLLEISESAVINGGIMVESKVGGEVRVNSGAKIHGYFQSNTETVFKGEFYGNMRVSNFKLEKSGGVYSNILNDVIISKPIKKLRAPFQTESSLIKFGYVKTLD